MFVKNLIDVSVSTLSISINADDEQVYSGNVKSVPYYLINDVVKELSIFSGILMVKI